MPRTLFGEDSPSIRLMQYGVYAGCVPYNMLSFLCKSGPYKLRSIQNTAKNLHEKGFLTDDHIMRLRVLIPTEYAMDRLGSELFIGARGWYTYQQRKIRRRITTNKSSAQVQRRHINQLLSTADEILFIQWAFALQNDQLLAGLTTGMLPGEKPDVNHMNLRGHMSYMTAYEMKAGLDNNRVRAASGRAQGYLLSGPIDSVTFSGGYNLQVYSCTRAMLQISEGREQDTRKLVNTVLAKHGNGFLNGEIILAKDTGDMLPLLSTVLPGEQGSRHEARHSLKVDLNRLDNRRTWFLPLTKEGAMLLAMLLTPLGELALQVMPANYIPAATTRRTMSFLHDFYDEKSGVYYLSFLTPNLYRLKRFVNAAMQMPNDKFKIVCFDILADAVEQYIQILSDANNISVEVWSFDKSEIIYNYTREKIRKQKEAEAEMNEMNASSQ